MTEAPQARPASTVVLLRDTPQGLETLLLKRNKALLFAGGLWVFPGGAVDPEDMEAAGGNALLASRLAAAREAMEEAGLSPRLDDMVLLSHWTTPLVEPKRFSTWIYAAPLDADDEVVIDGGEIHEARWVTVRQAVAEHAAGELDILPPTYITLRTLAAYDSVAGMLSEQRTSASPEVFPVFTRGTELPTVMFRGDAGYDNGDVNTHGARHRAVLQEGHWNYVYADVDATYPRLAPV